MRPRDERLGDRGVGFVCDQGEKIGIEALLPDHFAGDLDGDGQGKDRPRMGLDDDRVAGHQARKEPRVAIPGGEGRAADHRRHPARHDPEAFVQPHHVGLADLLLPGNSIGAAIHLLPRIGDRLQRPVLGVWAARLECHHAPLAGRVHDSVCALEASGVEPLEGDIQVRPWIADPQRSTVGRDLSAHGAFCPGLIDLKTAVKTRLEGRQAVGLGGLAIVLAAGNLGIGAEVVAFGDGGAGGLQGLPMTIE